MSDVRDVEDRKEGLRPVTFHLLRLQLWVAIGSAPLFAAMAGMLGFLGVITQRAVEGIGGVVAFVVFGLFGVVALVLPVWLIRRARREGEIVIDPVRGEIRIARDHEIPFSQVRQIKVVQHEYTYVGAGLEGGSYSADITGWAIDIGGGHRLFGEDGLSRKRVAEIADALQVRVEAYRARTREAAAPLPRPSRGLLERLAGSLHAEGHTFEEEWLSLEGSMAELMREFCAEPDERTMGRDGEFAQALRKAGYDLGDAPAKAAPPAEDAG